MLFNLQNTTAYKIQPSIKSSDADWIAWHRALKSDLGQQLAATTFISMWAKEGTSSANTVALRNYLQPEGITLDESAWDHIADIGSSVGDKISSFGNNISNVFKFGEVAVGVTVLIVVAGLGMVIYNIAKDPAKAAGTAVKYAI